MSQNHTKRLTLAPEDGERLMNLAGQLDENLKLIQNRLNVTIYNLGVNFTIEGSLAACDDTAALLKQLYQETAEGWITLDRVHLHLQQLGSYATAAEGLNEKPVEIRTARGMIRPRGKNQQKYVRSIQARDINFGIGPAGTGKTYLAVACAVEALEREEVSRILLVRPAVEAGEKLGFLPGDLAQKVDPYLRPLYDALYEMIGFEKVGKLLEKNVIEVAPLAYMRGRTLNDAFVILDESQNTTKEQMKMFLTRIGFGSTAVITGDITQIDLPKGIYSGLKHAIEVLDGVEGIGFSYFTAADVVRHPLVQHIVQAYDRFEQSHKEQGQ